MEAVQGVGGLVVGYWIYNLFSHPLKFKSKIPSIRFKLIELLPNLKINLKKKIIHVHHWILLSVVVALLIIYTSSFAHLLIVKSFFIGGIIQGFTFKDRFKIILNNR